MKYNCIVVLGPTASGKTHLACQLAYRLQGEIISADSRQVYKGLDIGTGKDLQEYVVQGKNIPYHLIDITEPGEQFYLHEFAEELKKAFEGILSRNHLPIICGGTGLYLDALKKDFSLTQIKENPDLRAELEHQSKEDLLQHLKKYPEALWHQVDLNSKKRIIRGIEIAEHLLKQGAELKKVQLPYKPYYLGINIDIESRKQKISGRLVKRIENGLIEEVEGLIKQGISHERLENLGLEYKFVSRFIRKEINKEQLISNLQTAIFQFAKRQMTWFRKMEKEGVEIHWLRPDEDVDALARPLKLQFQTP